jgi:hypothetical protein
MKRGIEHSDLRNAGTDDGARGGDSAEIVRIVKRCEVDKLFELAAYLIIDAHRLTEALSSMHDAMSNRLDLSNAADRHAGFLAREPADDVFDCGGMVANGVRAPDTLAILRRQRENCLTANSFHLSASKLQVGSIRNGRFISADQLEFD